MKRTLSGSYRSLLAVLFSMMALAPAAWAQQEATCEEALTEAERMYHRGDFGEAIQLLEQPAEGPDKACWEALSYNEDLQLEALRLLSIAYFAIDDVETSAMWVEELVSRDNRYRPDPEVDPIFFRRLVLENRRKHARKRWLFIGGGLAIAGGAAAIFLPNDPPASLPGPGDFFPPPGQ